MKKDLLGKLISVGVVAFITATTCVAIGLTNSKSQIHVEEDLSGSSISVGPEEVYLVKLEVSKKPNKIMYEAGETFDPTGMELTATYSDGTVETITEGFTCSYVGGEDISHPLDKSISQIKITWKDKNAYLSGIAVRDKTIIGNTFRFEAEKAELISVNDSKPYDCRYIDLADNASEGRCVNIRLEKADTTVADGNGVSFVINSDQTEESVEAQLFVRVAMRAKYVTSWTGSPKGNTMKVWVPYQKNFSEMYRVMVNNQQMSFTNILTAYGVTLGETNSHNSFNEFNWRTVSTNIKLKKGQNVINLTTLGNGKSTGPLDYIDVVVPSGINLTDGATNICKHVAEDESAEWQLIKKPTTTEYGYIGKKCAICGDIEAMEQLPKLNPADYTKVDATQAATATRDGIGTYTYTIDGQNIVLENQIIPATGEHHIYRYEAENAHLEGESTLGSAISHVNNTIYSGNGTIEASNQGYVGNFGKTGNKLSYKLHADKAVTAKVSFRFSSVVGEEKKFADLYNVKVNNNPAFLEDYTVPTGVTALTEYSDVGFDWNVMTSYVDLVQGDNDIVFEINGEYDQHIDYMEVDSTAVIENKTEGCAHHMCFYACIIPNFEKFGLIVYGCDQCLMNRTCNENATFLTIPALNKTDYEYSIVTIDDEKYERYTYYLNQGEEVHFDFKY